MVPSRQESVKWPEECQTAMKAPSNQNGKEGSQESARKAPSCQQDFERPVVSKERSAVRRARLKRVLNTVFRRRRSVIGERGVVVGREGVGKP